MDYTLPCRDSHNPRSSFAHRARQASHQHSRPPPPPPGTPRGRVLSAAPKIVGSGELAPLEVVGLDTADAQGARWLPAVRSSPHVCVVGVQSPNLLAPGSYGRVTAELQALWALAHGMEYRLVTCDLTGGRGAHKHWNKPRAVLAALGGVSGRAGRQGGTTGRAALPRRPSSAGNRTLAGDGAAGQQAPACDWVFMIDADAAVRSLSVGLQHLLSLARVRPTLTLTPTLTPTLTLTLTRCATSVWDCNPCLPAAPLATARRSRSRAARPTARSHLRAAALARSTRASCWRGATRTRGRCWSFGRRRAAAVAPLRRSSRSRLGLGLGFALTSTQP